MLLSTSLLVFVLLSTFVLTSNAHDPITTKVRFNKEVIRTLQRSCLGCHHPGGIAFSLASYDDARPWAKAIKEEVLEKRMPPWNAVKGYGEFRNAPALTQRDVDLLVNWVEGGAPKGDDKDLPTGALYSNDWQLGKPDLILNPDSESLVASDVDEQRFFILQTSINETKRLTAVDLLPGAPAVVHCATVYLLRSEPQAPMMQIKEEDSKVTPDLQHAIVLATWVPGQKSISLDAGIARLLPAGARVALRIHYRGAGEATKDLSQVGLYFAKTPTRKLIHELPINGLASDPTSGAHQSSLKATFSIKSDTEAIAIRPVVDPYIVSFQATAYRPDGTQEVLIWTRGYQFDWEPTYYFKRPISVPKGSRIDVIGYVDSSDENRTSTTSSANSRAASRRTLCSLLITSETDPDKQR